MFSITNTQPESAISIGQLNWQGMNAICNFTAISKVLRNYYNINLYKKITRASNEKKVNLLIYTVSFVKQQNMILQRLAFVISRTFFSSSTASIGSFRFQPNQFDTKSEIQCFQQVKPGFEVKVSSRAVWIYRSIHIFYWWSYRWLMYFQYPLVFFLCTIRNLL